MVSVTHRPQFTPEKDPVSFVQEAEWTPRPVWTGEENLASTGIRSLDRPARSQSLHRLSYPAHPSSGDFRKICEKEANISFVVYVRLSVPMNQLGSIWTDLHKIYI